MTAYRHILDETLKVYTDIETDLETIIKLAHDPQWSQLLALSESTPLDNMPGHLAAFQKYTKEAYFYIADNWNEIKGNDLKTNEVNLFIKGWKSLYKAAYKYTSVCEEHGDRLYKTTGEHHYSEELLLLIRSSESIINPIVRYIEDNIPDQYSKSSLLKGICEEMSQYFTGIDDHILARAIIEHKKPENKGTWTGPRNSATIFGNFYTLTCKEMNELFSFHDKQGNPSPLNYSQDSVKKLTESYPIYSIISKYKL